jgi:predicted nuclease with TOPRIM domain
MAEFDTLLQKYGELTAEANEAREYLSHLEEEREMIRKRLKAIAKNGSKTDTPVDEQERKTFDGAMEETVKALAELGNSVSAAQLAEHLKITQDAARLRLQRAEKKRRIIRVAFGRYASKPAMQIVRPTVIGASTQAETANEGGDSNKRTA